MKQQIFPKAYTKVTDKVALKLLVDYLIWNKNHPRRSDIVRLTSGKVYKYGNKLINSIYIEYFNKEFSEGYSMRFFQSRRFYENK